MEKISSYTVHLHISDPKGEGGERVEMGRGDIDFDKLWLCIRNHLPHVPFIPEIWQGYINQGDGFWKTLSYLEGIDNRTYN